MITLDEFSEPAAGCTSAGSLRLFRFRSFLGVGHGTRFETAEEAVILV
jgi:hypothetical protein